MDNLYTVLITVVTMLGGASAWLYYETLELHKVCDEDFIRHDCKDRISKLEALLAESSKERDEMRKQILELVSEVASLRTSIKFLTDKNRNSI
jgi:uncharacterized coiled-coil protein SlyX